jgi:acetyl esterase/lipase
MRFHLIKMLPGLLLLPSLAYAAEGSSRFQRVDRNGDGVLTPEELKGPVFRALDRDGDGRVTVAEEAVFLAQRAGSQQGRAPVPDTVLIHRDIEYADTDHPRQRLDLYLPRQPRGDQPLPLIVSIHGGGWRQGDKQTGNRFAAEVAADGRYAVASIGYRLTGDAPWPAQIHDCKAAIRWLRAHAGEYGFDPEKIGVTGASAGGHLSAMLGTSGGAEELEGTLGNHGGTSSRVACVVNQYGPANLLTMGGMHNGPDSPEAALLGGPVPERQEAARAASPISYVTTDDPPMMCIHGTADGIVPFAQSKEFQAAIEKAGRECILITVTDGGHGSFRNPAVPDRLRRFFDHHLLGEPTALADEELAAGLPEQR